MSGYNCWSDSDDDSDSKYGGCNETTESCGCGNTYYAPPNKVAAAAIREVRDAISNSKSSKK